MDPADVLPELSFLAPRERADALERLLDERTGGDPLVAEAVEVASLAHRFHDRDEGDPYIVHPLRVTISLTAIDAPAPVLAAALCHDIFEDAPQHTGKVWAMGPEVGDLVEALTDDWYEDYFDKIISAGAPACRIKLADRIDNMRFLHLTHPAKQVRYRNETRRAFPPIATTAESPVLAAALWALLDWHDGRAADETEWRTQMGEL